MNCHSYVRKGERATYSGASTLGLAVDGDDTDGTLLAVVAVILINDDRVDDGRRAVTALVERERSVSRSSEIPVENRARGRRAKRERVRSGAGNDAAGSGEASSVEVQNRVAD